jgi:hypothetical protein
MLCVFLNTVFTYTSCTPADTTCDHFGSFSFAEEEKKKKKKCHVSNTMKPPKNEGTSCAALEGRALRK